MCVRNKRLPFSVVPMKRLYVGPVTAMFTMLISSPENITAFPSFTLVQKILRFVISVRRGVAWYSAAKIEQYYAENVTIQFTKLMKNTIDFFYLESSFRLWNLRFHTQPQLLLMDPLTITLMLALVNPEPILTGLPFMMINVIWHSNHHAKLTTIVRAKVTELLRFQRVAFPSI